MRFRTRESQSRYIVEPQDTIVLANGRKSGQVVGLSVQAHNHFIDTDKVAVEDGWTPEQRIAVELKLLQHHNLGKSFASANMGAITIEPSGPGGIDVDRDIPQDVEDAMKGIRAEVAQRLGLSSRAQVVASEPISTEETCRHLITEDDGSVRPCKNKPVDGPFCRKHAPAPVPA